ncbi:MAG: YaeQ family protein [Acidimicrobiia bacterium]|nr:YaeQ family protein [Acidimicrobiia bacterium]
MGATVYNFDTDRADADRQTYATLALRVARHPSELPEYLVTRALAWQPVAKVRWPSANDASRLDFFALGRLDPRLTALVSFQRARLVSFR